MPTQQQIEDFTLLAHEYVVRCLREDPALLNRAIATLDRWHAQRGPVASDVYAEQWRVLIRLGVDAIEQATCRRDDKAAVMRSTSPFGFVLSQEKRRELRAAAGMRTP